MSQSEYRLNREFADVDELQRYLNDIARRLVRAEEREGKIDDATRNLLAFALQRIDETLRPAIELIGQISAFGLLAFEFDSEFELVVGENTLAVPSDKRAAFSPTPVLTFGRTAEGEENEYAVARLDSYDKNTGALTVTVTGISAGLAGVHDDWFVACSAGVAPTVVDLVAQAQTAADDAGESADAAAASAAAANTWNPANYYTKSVMDAALAGKAAASHGHQIADVSGLAAALGGKADAATAATLTGAQELTNKTLTQPVLTLEQGSSPAPTTEGRVAWDTDDDVIVVGTGSGQKIFPANPASMAAGDLTISLDGKNLKRLPKGGAGQYLKMMADGSEPEWTNAGGRGTAVATTSGTAFDFTGIPSGVSKITVMLSGVSLSGSDNLLVQIGDSGGVENTDYVSGSDRENISIANSALGFVVLMNSAGESAHGSVEIERVDGNIWVSTHKVYAASAAGVAVGGGSKTLSGELTQLRITRSGSNTFDAGKVNISWQ